MAAENHFPVYPGWETVRLLGQGSFGAVYEIRRDVLGLQERAALKHISLPQSQSEVEELLNSGYDEASITAQFRSYLADIVREYKLMVEIKGHTNVVNCDDIRCVQKDVGIGWDIFIKMELLTPMLKAMDQLEREEQIMKLGQDLASALVLCRSRNILHRDIKPQNIFLSQDGDFKLGDFGIAKTAEKTGSGTKIGTYNYMAPEVFNNRPYGHEADIFSLGMVLYWLLNERRLPFYPLPPAVPLASDMEQARLRRFRGEEIPAPLHGSPALQWIVLKCCAYDPRDRYRSAEELLQDLKTLGGRASSALAGESLRGGAGKVPGAAAEGTMHAFADRGKNGLAVGRAEVPSNAPETQTAERTEGEAPPPPLPPRRSGRSKKILALVGLILFLLLAVLGFFTIHIWEPASCTQPETCKICGKTRGAVLSHGWAPASCDTPETCSVCGLTRGEALGHEWVPASCETPEICRVCGLTRGEALGHNWIPATYDSPQTCSRCGATSGEVKGYVGTLKGSFGEPIYAYGNTQFNPFILDERMVNCMRLTVSLYIDDISGDPYGEWYVLSRDLSENWEIIGQFYLSPDNVGTTMEYTVMLDGMTSFTELTIAPVYQEDWTISVIRLSFVQVQQYLG